MSKNMRIAYLHTVYTEIKRLNILEVPAIQYCNKNGRTGQVGDCALINN